MMRKFIALQKSYPWIEIYYLFSWWIGFVLFAHKVGGSVSSSVLLPQTPNPEVDVDDQIKICGSIELWPNNNSNSSGAAIKISVEEDETFNKDFRLIKNKLGIWSPKFYPKPNCQFVICGFSAKEKQNTKCMNLFDFLKLGREKGIAPIFPEDYLITSMSCGCARGEAECIPGDCHEFSVGENCAVLAQEIFCRGCYFRRIELAKDKEFVTGNSFVILSLAVHKGCRVIQRSTTEQLTISPERVQNASNYLIRPFNDTSGQIFKCICEPGVLKNLLSNNDANVTKNATIVTGIVGASFSNSWLVLIAYFVVIIFVAFGGAIFLSFLKISKVEKKFENILTHGDIEKWKNGQELYPIESGNETADFESASRGHRLAFEQPFDENYLIRRSRLEFTPDRQNMFGAGEFGTVYKGLLTSDGNETAKPVAVKCLNEGINSDYTRFLLNEIKVIGYVKGHPNIIDLIGACIDNCQVFVLLELCSNGNLKDYLTTFLSSQPLEIVRIGNARYARSISSAHAKDDITFGFEISERNINRLNKWCSDISSGMQFLRQKQVTHIDLAAKNILLDENLKAKIADFGLSRTLPVGFNYTRLADNNKLPYKWMALEVLRNKKYSIESDIWSFGITIWEIYSLGQDPYSLIDSSQIRSLECSEIISKLESGWRLGKPICASMDIYAIMMACWSEDPEMRPSFDSLVDLFRSILK